jgi:integrase
MGMDEGDTAMGSWRQLARLTPLSVRNARLGRGKTKGYAADGGGLLLQISRGPQGQLWKSWVFRYDVGGKRTDIGLGGVGTRTLKEAREVAKQFRLMLLDGDDPLHERRRLKESKLRERQEHAAAQAARKTFSDCASLFLAKHQSGWKNQKHREQWKTTLEGYANPVIGQLFVGDITTPNIVAVLTRDKLWDTRRETARRLLGRIERVLNFATASGYRSGSDNPARWSGHLRDLLPHGGTGRPEHHAALAYVDIPQFMAELRAVDTPAARALEFTILTAARTGETIGATLDELDLKAKTWTVPASRMKSGKEHKVPLPYRTIEILRQQLERAPGSDRVFPLGHDKALLRLLKSMRQGCTVHGFRSAFMDWAHEQTAFPKVVIDMALAHAVSDKVEAAYRRGDLFAKRTKLMQAWADYCAKPVQASATVTPMRARQ